MSKPKFRIQTYRPTDAEMRALRGAAHGLELIADGEKIPPAEKAWALKEATLLRRLHERLIQEGALR